jgi:hypothetical protein
VTHDLMVLFIVHVHDEFYMYCGSPSSNTSFII